MPRSKSKSQLSAKQELFSREYLVDLNATQAAVRAGYSQKTARAIGFELLQDPRVQAEIQRRANLRAQRTDITADRVLEEIARVSFVDIGDFMTWDGRQMTIRSLADLTPEQRSAIAELSESQNATGINRRIKFHDKLKSLELLGRHLKLFRDQLDVNILPPKPLEDMTDAELAEYRASLLAIESRRGTQTPGN